MKTADFLQVSRRWPLPKGRYFVRIRCYPAPDTTCPRNVTSFWKS